MKISLSFKKLIPQRLAFKLLLALTIIVVVVEGISGYINARTQEAQLREAMILGADQLSKSIVSATWHAMLADHRNSAYEVMQTIALKQGVQWIRIFNREGQVMFSTRPNELKQVDKRAEVCAVCHTSSHPVLDLSLFSRSRVFSDTGGRRKLAIVTPIYNEPACSQAACHAHPSQTKVLGVLDLALDLHRVDQEVAGVQLRMLAVTGIHVLLLGIFMVFFTKHLVDVPIRKLIDGMRAMSAMQWDKPVEIHSSAELGELAKSINDMRERLRLALDEVNYFTQSLESKVLERTAQLKTAHQKLMQSDRLASLGQLSASVAHEINNPISGVLNLAMLMQRILKDDGIPPNRIPEFRKYLSQVIHETARVGRIVSDLLAFSRRSKPQRSLADLNGIIRTTASLVAHKLQLSNVQMHSDLQQDLPRIQCDSSQIQQVVMNLILNAAEATQGQERREISVKTAADREKDALVMEVCDNGEGIAPEIMPKIFDPFFTTKEEGKGVGLGLAVVYGIVEAHGGEIEVQSAKGSGSTFKVTFPLPKEKQSQAQVPAKTGSTGSTA